MGTEDVAHHGTGALADPGDGVSRRRFLLGAGATLGGVVGALVVADTALAHEGDEPEEPEATEPGVVRLRRFAMVVDRRVCDGCKGLGVPPQCTQVCNWGRFVPEGQEWVEVFEVESDNDGPSSYLPSPCMQCQNAPCVNVCPVGASFHTPGGVVLIDQERCIGCRLCMAACPYDRRFFNWGEPVQPSWVREQPYNVLTQVPAKKGTVMKCDFCTDRAIAGGLPYCVEDCPRGALWFGDLEEDIATNGSNLVVLSRFIDENNASPYKEELGTQPRVFYVEGHGELAGRKTPDEDTFLKHDLEWPWRRIVAESERRAAAAREG